MTTMTRFCLYFQHLIADATMFSTCCYVGTLDALVCAFAALKNVFGTVCGSATARKLRAHACCNLSLNFLMRSPHLVAAALDITLRLALR